MDVRQECEELIERARLAYRFMTCTLECNDFWRLRDRIDEDSNCYTSVMLGAQDVADEFCMRHFDVERAGYDDSFPTQLYDQVFEYAKRAAAEAASTYEFGEAYNAMLEWGAELIEEYAAKDGVTWPKELGLQAMRVAEGKEPC